jgi:xanthine dehydrogenase small subunit
MRPPGNELCFRLNGERRAEVGLPPSMTVLDYLRTVRRLTGTKEGCAEGDCGACTIAVAYPARGESRYKAVNSCLMMLGQVDGADIVTVEGLSSPDGPLHPVQQALIDTDGTQCGFCTPGFVMAMFALQQSGERLDDDTIHDALAGNLCRCTGYRPIVEACRHLALAATVTPSSGPMPSAEYRCGEQRFYAPTTLHELADLRSRHPEAWLLGGGTDLGLLVSKERQRPQATISTAAVPELKRIAAASPALEVGGAVTYAEALSHLDTAFPSFGQLVRRIGSRQIRNLGTLAGNLATASPIGDTLPCLIALDAEVVLRAKAEPRSMPVERFIVGYRRTALAPGEFVQTIRIPHLASGQRFVAYKLSKRFDQDISAVVAGFRFEVVDGRLRSLRAAYGGMAATPARAKNLESALVGRPWSDESLTGIDDVLAKDFMPIGDHRAGAAYRLRAAANLLRRLVAETSLGGGAPARVDVL